MAMDPLRWSYPPLSPGYIHSTSLFTLLHTIPSTLLYYQVFLNYLTNYVPGIWSEADGCTACDETYFPLPDDSGVWPTVLVAMMIPGPSPFLLEVLEGVSGLDYPHSRMSLFLHNQVITYITSLC